MQLAEILNKDRTFKGLIIASHKMEPIEGRHTKPFFKVSKVASHEMQPIEGKQLEAIFKVANEANVVFKKLSSKASLKPGYAIVITAKGKHGSQEFVIFVRQPSRVRRFPSLDKAMSFMNEFDNDDTTYEIKMTPEFGELEDDLVEI